MKTKFIVVAVMLAVAAAASMLYKVPYERPTEDWLESQMLTELGRYELVKGEYGDRPITYRMDEVSYETLDPIGIACQRMSDGGSRDFDVVVIAGDSMKAFHDQQICFNAQGWNIVSTKTIYLPTENRGQVPTFLMEINREEGEPTRTALYMFRAPGGYKTYNWAKVDFFMNQLTTGKPGLGYSYRFIGLSEDLTEDDVIAFAKNYLDKLYEESGGKV